MMLPKRTNIISLAFTSGVSLNQYKYHKMGVTSYQTKKITIQNESKEGQAYKVLSEKFLQFPDTHSLIHPNMLGPYCTGKISWVINYSWPLVKISEKKNDNQSCMLLSYASLTFFGGYFFVISTSVV